MTRDERSELVEIVRASGWHIRVLATVHDSRLPDAWVGAGAIRDLVWGVRFGSGFDPAVVRDVDAAYFDPGGLGRDRDERATRLHDAWPAVPWEARNQAAVHTWYAPKFGVDSVEPFVGRGGGRHLDETATTVAVRLDNDDRIEVCAPVGLFDLLGGVWRRNPRRVTSR